jgi:hypothetical protein
MTEADWLDCTDLISMLDFLRDRASEPELRLFCIACCRRIWDVMPPEGRSAVEAAERYVNGQATEAELDAANEIIGDFCEHQGEGVRSEVRFAAHAAFYGSFWRCEVEEAEDCGRNSEVAGLRSEETCRLLREVVGNPFQEQGGRAKPGSTAGLG